MSFDDWTQEGKNSPQSHSSAPTNTENDNLIDPPPHFLEGGKPPELFLLDPTNRPVLTGDRRPLVGIPSGTGCLALFMLPFFLVGILFPIFWLRAWQQEQVIDADPVTVVARLSSHRVSSGDDSDSYYVTYVYRVGRDEYSREAEVSESEQARAVESKQVQVKYSQSHPGLSRALDENPKTLSGLFFFITCWDGFLGFIAVGGWGRWSRRRRLARDGSLRGGILTSVKSHLDGDDDLVLSLTYRFQDDGGRDYEQSLTRIRNDLKGASLPTVGSPVAVLFADPSRYMLL